MRLSVYAAALLSLILTPWKKKYYFADESKRCYIETDQGFDHWTLRGLSALLETYPLYLDSTTTSRNFELYLTI